MSSYDPNIEPAKDDVLFETGYLILEAVEGRFKDMYRKGKEAPVIITPQSSTRKVDEFELLLARKPKESSTNSSQSFPSTPITNNPPTSNENIARSIEGDENRIASNRSKWGFDMSKDFTKEAQDSKCQSHSKHVKDLATTHQSSQRQPNSFLNPWLIAKMTAPLQRNSDDTISAPSTLENPALQNTAMSSASPCQSSEPLFVDSRDPQIKSRPELRRRRYSNEIIMDSSLPMMVSPPYDHHGLPRRRYSNGDVGNVPRPMVANSNNSNMAFIKERTPHMERSNDFVTARDLPRFSLFSPPTTMPRSRDTTISKRMNQSFASPRISDAFRQTTLLVRPKDLDSHQRANEQMEVDSELAWAMDYEQRKEDATRRQRQEYKRARLDSLQIDLDGIPRSSPHENRYKSAIKALEADTMPSQSNIRVVELLETSLPDGDPRAYLMKQQRLQAVPYGGPLNLSRAKSVKLPLERIPNNLQIHGLLLTLSTSQNIVENQARRSAAYDTYISSGYRPVGHVIETTFEATLIDKVRAVVDKWLSSEEERRCEVEYTFEKLAEGGVSYDT